MNVPSYEEFEALQQQVADLTRQVAYLIGVGGEWMDRRQAMQALNCSESTLHRLMRMGKLIYRYEGKKPLFAADALRKYIESTLVSPASADKRVVSAIKRITA
ncbi:helix-turn-helix domain-containing protein [Spirosoma aerolatum]|uniref:helix-turn-helix domain-containing protein n=1 Tax=Spirosoma aerolatum TaxID=1211326 RepID=UPI0009AC159C|nr:helix-turn-helix domain-containing protein [Spirosoma aerolatum]